MPEVIWTRVSAVPVLQISRIDHVSRRLSPAQLYRAQRRHFASLWWLMLRWSTAQLVVPDEGIAKGWCMPASAKSWPYRLRAIPKTCQPASTPVISPE